MAISETKHTGKRVLDLLEAGDLRLRQVVVERITVVEFGVNDGVAMVHAVVESR